MVFGAKRFSLDARMFFLGIYGIFAVLIIGTRKGIGPDWGAYLKMVNTIYSESTSLSLSLTGEPGFKLLNWIMGYADLGIYGVNLFCGAIFIIGLVFFASKLPYTWFVIALAIPFLLVLVVMGYSRQGVALGFEMIALVYLSRKRFFLFYNYIFWAIMFHKSALALLLFGVFSVGKKSWRWILAGSGLMFFLVNAFSGIIHQLFDIYFTNPESNLLFSSGAQVRALMNLAPSILLILLRKRWKLYFDQNEPWFHFAFLNLLLTPFVINHSTFVDRLMIYLAPLQMVVWSRIPLLIQSIELRTLMIIGILSYYGVALFVVLNYAVHARYFVPYKSILGL
jgi:hypothetical protein